MGEDREFSLPTLTKFTQLAKQDPSPFVRLYLASVLQRMEFDDRWPLLSALAAREEDREDANIPRMLWFALEPMVPENASEALTLAVNSGAGNLQEFVARRMLEGEEVVVATDYTEQIEKVAPGFRLRRGESVELLSSFRSEGSLQTHPVNEGTSAVLFRNLNVLAGKNTTLKIRTSYHPHGDWRLRVRVARKELVNQIVNYETVQDAWLELDVDLTEFAGSTVEIAIENRANDGKNAFAYWGSIDVVSE